MNKKCKYRVAGLVVMALFLQSIHAQHTFVRVKNGKFLRDEQTYTFVGTNYWYGGLLGITDAGKQRIREELDFLKAKGVNNLRVLAAVEGSGVINGNPRVEPAYQTAAGQFNASSLTGLDFLLTEMGKRGLTAVIILSNNWEWSGGFLQYLRWNDKISATALQAKMEWEDMRDKISGFYTCQNCIAQYQEQVRNIVTRTNMITGVKYKDDPAIMAWEIANEPRPMRPVVIEQYKEFIHGSALLIRSLDPNHMVTTGSEGYIGSETMDVFKTVHQDPLIDYLTIHIWPKNWGWFSDTSIAKGFSQVIKKTEEYIRTHQRVAEKMKKPLVIEEFGLPRDGMSFRPTSATLFRDRYFSFILSVLKKDARNGGPVAGACFWAFGGKGRASGNNVMWQKGDDWLGDPPMEEQGLNTVFDNDHSTWVLIESIAASLAKLKK